MNHSPLLAARNPLPAALRLLFRFLRALGIGEVRCAWCAEKPGRLLGLRIGRATSHGLCAPCEATHFSGVVA